MPPRKPKTPKAPTEPPVKSIDLSPTVSEDSTEYEPPPHIDTSPITQTPALTAPTGPTYRTFTLTHTQTQTTTFVEKMSAVEEVGDETEEQKIKRLEDRRRVLEGDIERLQKLTSEWMKETERMWKERREISMTLMRMSK